MDVGAVVRAARRMRRVSQRDLARLAGVPRSTVDRIEAAKSMPRVDTMERLLDAIGFQLVVLTTPGRRLRVDAVRDELRDRGGRRFPAHLPLEGKPSYWGNSRNWWGWHHIAWWDNDPAVPEHTYWHPANTLPYTGENPTAAQIARLWQDAT